jgi:methylenetetrahydrofolate reductase (NADPH)
MMGSMESIMSTSQQSLPELSFEFFPPQGGDGVDRLLSGTVAKLNAFHPSYCSVTYGAGGSTRSGTQTLVERLLESGVNAVPHLSVGGSSDAELDQLTDHYQHIGVRQILCLRGDQPSNSGQRPVYAKDLVERLRSRYQDHFELSVAAYPEIHPDAASADADIQHFVAKVRAGASSAITQYFYNCDAYAFFLDRCAAAGLTVPVTVGIMPITNIESLQRFSAKVGADIPRWLEKSMSGYAEDEKSLIAFGVDVVTELCEKLLQMGVPGLHFYTLNRWGATSQICRNLGFREI